MRTKSQVSSGFANVESSYGRTLCRLTQGFTRNRVNKRGIKACVVGNPAHKVQNAHGVGSADVVNALGSKLRDAKAALGQVYAPGWTAHLIVHYPNSFSATQCLACPEDDVAAAKTGYVADDQNSSRNGIARSASLDCLFSPKLGPSIHAEGSRFGLLAVGPVLAVKNEVRTQEN